MVAVKPKAIAHVQAGKLHAPGVMSPQRSPVLPNVPTMVESGFADLSLSAWIGLFAPAKTPRPIIDQLNRAVVAALDAELKAKLAENGMEVAASTPEELERLIARDIVPHAELVKAAGLIPQKAIGLMLRKAGLARTRPRCTNPYQTLPIHVNPALTQSA